MLESEHCDWTPLSVTVRKVFAAREDNAEGTWDVAGVTTMAQDDVVDAGVTTLLWI